MERIVSGMKCRIVDHKEPFLVSFKRANIEWKKKYKRYLGQSALVLDLLEDNTVMLKMKNGKEYKFPSDCVQRLEEVNPQLNKEKLKWHDKRLGHCKRSVLADENVSDAVFSDEFSRDTTSTSEESKGNRSIARSASIERVSSSKIIRRQSKDLVILTRQTKEFSDLQQLLETFSLQKYYKNLVDEGFETIEYLSHAEMEDLRASGLKRGHARRLLRVLQEWRLNPNCTLQSINGKLQKRFSQVDSFTRRSSLNSGRGSSISRSSIPEYELFAPNDMGILPLIDTNQSGSRNVWNWVSPMSDGQTGRKDEGFIIIPFDQRPLGFGIMSPLSVGSMVSRITDDSLKVKGLDLFLPVLFINNTEIGRWNLEDVAHVISHTDLPFTITFGLQPYLRPGQDVMVRRDSQWHRGMVVRISKRSRKVTVKYCDFPATLSNIEKISDYNRLKLPKESGLEGSHGPAQQGQLTLSTSDSSPEKQVVTKRQNTDTKSELLSFPRNKQHPVSASNVTINMQRDVGDLENRKLRRSEHDETRLYKSCGDIMKPDGKIAIVDVNSMDFSTSSSVEDIPNHAVSEIV